MHSAVMFRNAWNTMKEFLKFEHAKTKIACTLKLKWTRPLFRAVNSVSLFFHSMNGHGGHGNPRDTCLKPSSCHKSGEATYLKRFFISSLPYLFQTLLFEVDFHCWTHGKLSRSNSHTVEFCRSMRSGTTRARKKPMRSECTGQASNWKVGYIGYTAKDVLSESCI